VEQAEQDEPEDGRRQRQAERQQQRQTCGRGEREAVENNRSLPFDDYIGPHRACLRFAALTEARDGIASSR